MKIRSFFLLCMTAVTIISLTLSSIIASVAWQRLAEKDAGIAAMQAFSTTLKALEMLTLERAPTNQVLIAEQASEPASGKRLADARANLDGALKELLVQTPAGDSQAREQIASLQRGIAASRVPVDREAVKPRAQREA